MRHVCWDVEADGLLDEATRIHSLVIQDLETGVVLSCTDDSDEYEPISTGLAILQEADRHYGHNLIGYDIPVLEKLYPDFRVKHPHKVFDTLVMTQLRYAHIKESDYARAQRGDLPSKLIGSQGLDAWGCRLGVEKSDYQGWCKEAGIEDPWAQWTPEMQSYCEQDVKVNVMLVEKLRKAGAISKESLEADLALSWYLAQQERNGWPIHEENLRDLIYGLSSRKQELEQTMIEHFGSWYQPDKEFVPKRDNSRYGYVEGCPVTKVKLVEFNPNSRHHIADRLQKLYGWEPKKFTPTGLPEVSEDTLEGLDIPFADELNEYLMLDKRLGQVATAKQAWTEHMTDKGYQGGQLTGCQHIHHSIRRVTITHRHIHSHPNLGQVPRVGTPWGAESRRCFTVPDGWVLLGSDADGLELRCLAHYMARYDGGAYAKALLEGSKDDGTDIHSMNAKALDLSRDDAKTWIYAWLYGAGDAKLGSISGRSVQASRAQKTRFLKRIPALKMLKDSIARAIKKGWILLPDDRRVYIRHEHAALNTLLQGSGSIIIKHWIVEFNRRLCERYGTPPGGGWQFPWAALGWIHDEVQVAVNPERADPHEAGKIITSSLPPIGEKFGWRLPLTAGFDLGQTWEETH
jgi:DNA polymerase I